MDPEMRAPRLSPDGTKVVYVATKDRKSIVAVYDLQTHTPRAVMQGVTERFRVTECNFKSDQLLLCAFEGVDYSRDQPYPVSRMVVIGTDGSGMRVLFENGEMAVSQFQDRIVALLPDDPRHVLVELTGTSDVFPSVFRLDVQSGNSVILVTQRPPVTDWFADQRGVVRFGFGYRQDQALYLGRDAVDDPWRTLEKFKRFEGPEFEPITFGATPNLLYVFASHEGRRAAWLLDLDEHSDAKLVYSNPEVDVEDVIAWPSDGHVAGFLYETDRPHTYYIDPQAAAIDAALEKAMPGEYHSVVSASRDGTKLLCASFSDVMPLRYFVLDLANKKFSALGQENSQLSKVRLATMKSVSVPGAGGIHIPGYLTLPVDAKPGARLPAIVYPHGGPYAQDHWGYDPIVQMLASRGYAVLQLNFRGSTGYGSAWRDAGHQAWGTVMHDDITAGAHWLLSEGIADPARMCIVGWSYGGYAALIGAVKEPQLYKCAVSIAGVSDLAGLQADDDRFYGGKLAVQDSTGTNKPELAAESPLRQADRIRIPVLLIHGEDDYTVLARHSKEMAKALTHAGVHNELVLIPHAEHALLGMQARLTLLTHLEAFLGQNLGKP